MFCVEGVPASAGQFWTPRSRHRVLDTVSDTALHAADGIATLEPAAMAA